MGTIRQKLRFVHVEKNEIDLFVLPNGTEELEITLVIRNIEKYLRWK